MVDGDVNDAWIIASGFEYYWAISIALNTDSSNLGSRSAFALEAIAF